MGSSTFRRAVVRARRLNCWKTNPILRLRIFASAFSSSRATCSPSSSYEPDVGRSRQPMTFISVDLPDPEGPMIATISPAPTCSETPLSTVRSSPPVLYVLTMSLTVIMGPVYTRNSIT